MFNRFKPVQFFILLWLAASPLPAQQELINPNSGFASVISPLPAQQEKTYLQGHSWDSSALFEQDNESDTVIHSARPAFSFRISGGPAVIAIDGGYYFQNELAIGVSRNFDVVFNYGTGNSYAGMQDVQRWYLPGAQPATDDINRHQSFFAANAMMRINLLKGDKHRLFGSLGPGINFYTFSEGSLVPYGPVHVYKLSNKQTVRMSVSLQAGYEYLFTDHLSLGISLYGSQSTEFMYSLLLSAGYRL